MRQENQQEYCEGKQDAKRNFGPEDPTLRDEIIILGSMVENAIIDSGRGVDRSKIWQPRGGSTPKTIASTKNASSWRMRRSQPSPRNSRSWRAILRLLASMLEVTSELERMGDYAKGIAKITLLLGDQSAGQAADRHPTHGADYNQHAAPGHRGVCCQNVEVARKIPAEDDQVDDLYNQVYRELVDDHVQNPDTIDRANYLMWAAHNWSAWLTG